MSVRARIAGTAAIAAALAAVAPAAHAATPTAASARKPSIVMTLGAPAPHGPLMPGGRAETFTLTATNTTATAQPFEPTFSAYAQGPLGMVRSDVKLAVVPVHAPATTLDYGTQDGGLMGGFMPKGGKVYKSWFTLAAHGSYTWKVTVAAGTTWQANDNALHFTMANQASPLAGTPLQHLSFKVGKARTGGPVTVSFRGANKLVLDKFENVDVTLTNHSGARLNLPINDQLNFGAYTVAGNVFKPAFASAVIQVLENGHWVTLGKNQALPTLAGLANGASHTFHLRVRLNGYTTIKGGTTKAYVGDIAWNPTRGPIARLSESLNIANH